MKFRIEIELTDPKDGHWDYEVNIADMFQLVGTKARDLYLHAFASEVPLGRLVEIDGDATREVVADAIWDALAPLR